MYDRGLVFMRVVAQFEKLSARSRGNLKTGGMCSPTCGVPGKNGLIILPFFPLLYLYYFLKF